MRRPMPPTYAAAWLSPRRAPGASPSRSPEGLTSGRSGRNLITGPPPRSPPCGGAGRTEIGARDSHPGRRRPEAPVDGAAGYRAAAIPLRRDVWQACQAARQLTTTRTAEPSDRRGGGRDECPARGSLRCMRSFRCAARRESGFSTGCRAAGASSAACCLADDATGWSGGVSIPISMAHLPR